MRHGTSTHFHSKPYRRARTFCLAMPNARFNRSHALGLSLPHNDTGFIRGAGNRLHLQSGVLRVRRLISSAPRPPSVTISKSRTCIVCAPPPSAFVCRRVCLFPPPTPLSLSTTHPFKTRFAVNGHCRIGVAILTAPRCQLWSATPCFIRLINPQLTPVTLAPLQATGRSRPPRDSTRLRSGCGGPPRFGVRDRCISRAPSTLCRSAWRDVRRANVTER